MELSFIIDSSRKYTSSNAFVVIPDYIYEQGLQQRTNEMGREVWNAGARTSQIPRQRGLREEQ